MVIPRTSPTERGLIWRVVTAPLASWYKVSIELPLRHSSLLFPRAHIASTDPECKWTESALAEKLGVIRQTVNTWISDIRARQKSSRNTVILRLSRLGWVHEKIAEVVGLSRNRISEIVGNANFGNIDILLSQGRDMAYIASHYNMDLALAWALRLEGKTDQEKFKALEWGQRTWDQWYFNKCDERFGDDWPEFRLNWWRMHCFTSQNLWILFLIQWPAEVLCLMCALFSSANAALLIIQSGTIALRSCTIIGILKIGSGPFQKNRI